MRTTLPDKPLTQEERYNKWQEARNYTLLLQGAVRMGEGTDINRLRQLVSALDKILLELKLDKVKRKTTSKSR
jgi:hypothetical protein